MACISMKWRKTLVLFWQKKAVFLALYKFQISSLNRKKNLEWKEAEILLKVWF